MELEIAPFPPLAAGADAPRKSAAKRSGETAKTVLNLDTAVLDVRRMTEADRLTVANGKTTIELMEAAGRAVALAIRQRWSPRLVTVLCGTGGNGGDGLVTARHLAEAGWPTRVALLGCMDQLSGATRHHAEQWEGDVDSLTPAALDGADLVVDALFGAGLNRALAGPSAEVLTAAESRGLPIVAIDVPSGVMGDTGAAMGAVRAV